MLKQNEEQADTKNDFRWAIHIVADKFREGLEQICNEWFLKERYKEFQRTDDPIYVKPLEGMNDQSLSETFVSYWTIAQTLATQSRFWLENVLTEIILHQTEHFGRNVESIYSGYT